MATPNRDERTRAARLPPVEKSTGNPSVYVDPEDAAEIKRLLRNESVKAIEDFIYELQAKHTDPELADVAQVILGDKGTNPLHEAAGKGKTHALAHLLSPSHDANVYAVDNNGNSPLHYAAANGNLETVKLLARHMWRTHVLMPTNNKGETPLDVAKTKQYHAIVSCLQSELTTANERANVCKPVGQKRTPESFRSTSKTKAGGKKTQGSEKRSVEATGTQVHHIRRAIFFADFKDLEDQIRSMQDKHVELSEVTQIKLNSEANNQDLNPVHMIITMQRENRYSLLSHILENHDANLDVGDKEGNTPLHHAVDKEDLEMVKLLVEGFQCHYCQKNQKGKTPLSICTNKDIESYLKRKIDERKNPGGSHAKFDSVTPILAQALNEGINKYLHRCMVECASTLRQFSYSNYSTTPVTPKESKEVPGSDSDDKDDGDPRDELANSFSNLRTQDDPNSGQRRS